MYSLRSCDGSATYDVTRCAPCGSCQPNQYQIAFCDGTTTSDSTLCAPCNVTSCKPMNVLVGQCTGRGTSDTARCVPCTDPTGTGCGYNQYMGTMCSSASLYDGQCRNCDTACISAGSNSPAAPTGQFKLIPCTGATSSNLVCANCTQNCQRGYYVTNLCNGTGTSDTATCAPCTCPSGYYAPNNTCNGTTTSNVLSCVPCTSSNVTASCPLLGVGYYLSGQCSTFSNPQCTPCRTQCGAAEIEVRPCANGTNRLCLPDPSCFQDCPAGYFESRACLPPAVRQVCSPCTTCPKGYYTQVTCSAKADTVCARCTSSVCADDRFNAQFAALGGCQGSESSDTALCGVITESYGQRCAPNSYRFQGRVPMPHSWGLSTAQLSSQPNHPAWWSDSALNDTVTKMKQAPASYLAFDVHPARKVYAYCFGNAIFTYDYEGLRTGTFLDFAYLPEHCSDIRFSSLGSYLMASSRNSTTLFRCDPQCTTSDPFVRDAATFKYACASPAPSRRRWGDGLRVQCIAWMPTASTTDPVETSLAAGGAQFAGGVQMVGGSRTSTAENLIYAAGSFRGNLAEKTSWLWWANSDVSPSGRGLIYAFPAGVQIVGPPAYNERVRMVFVPVHNNTDKSRRLLVYQVAVTGSGTLDKTKLTNGVSIFYSQSFADSIVPSALKTAGLAPVIPGFAVRLDTGVIGFVDEQEGRVHVLACSAYAMLASTCDTLNAPVASTSFGAAAYKDLEFVGQIPFSSSVVDPLTTPSKMFFTTLQDPSNPHAELYVQCSKCQGGGITSTEVEAMSEQDCFCLPGYMIVSATQTQPRR